MTERRSSSPGRARVGRLALLLAVVAVACGEGGEGGRSGEGGTRRETAPPQLPNVLLVSIDSLRPDHLGSYGYRRETSPTIDRLAREGFRFETAISSSSWTLPTHITLLTALSPERHGVTDNYEKLDDAAVTLAEVLHDAGYTTAGFVSGPYLRALYGYGQGFDVYDESAVENGHLASHKGATSPRLVEQVVAWLDDWAHTGRGRPFFVFLHMWDVHYDYAPPEPYASMFDPDYDGEVTGTNFVSSNEVHAGMDRRDLDHVVALYDGEIRYTDDHLGQVIDHLAALGALDDTIVVVTADHGEEFFEHGGKGHGFTLYDELIRVPLVIRYPPRVAAARVEGLQVRLMDVAPTVLGLAALPVPPGFGEDTALGARDLSPWLGAAPASDAFPDLPAFSHRVPFGKARAAEGPLLSARRPDAKYIERTLSSEGAEFYDLSADPGERTNLAARNGASGRSLSAADRREELAADLRRWNRDHAGGGSLATKIELEDEQRQRLLTLGYIE